MLKKSHKTLIGKEESIYQMLAYFGGWCERDPDEIWCEFLGRIHWLKIGSREGRAIAQAVSRWLPTAAAWVRARVWSCGICCGKSGAGAGFLRVLRFPLPIFIPPIASQSPSSIIWGKYNRPEVAAVPSGLSPTPLIIIKNNRVTWQALATMLMNLQLFPARTGIVSSPPRLGRPWDPIKPPIQWVWRGCCVPGVKEAGAWI
jgi:hypothetical protein